MSGRTKKMLDELNSVEFISKGQALLLAKTALNEFSMRSRAAKSVDRSVYDMVLAGGCPNEVRGNVEKLVEYYSPSEDF